FVGGGVSNVTINANTITNPRQEAVVVGEFASLSTSAGDNSNISITNNTVTVDASMLGTTSAFAQSSYAFFDMVGGLSGTNSISNNSLTVTGSLPSAVKAIYGVKVSGTNLGILSDPQVVRNLTLSGNTLTGGTVGGAGTATLPPTSGLFVDTDLLSSSLDL